jgi:uncharacterized protein YcgI (DUF1989 family)
MTIAGGYKGYLLRLRRDKTARIIEIFGPACGDIALSAAKTVAEAKRWIDDYIDLEQTIADLIDRKKKLDLHSPEYQLINRMLTKLRYSPRRGGGIIEIWTRSGGALLSSAPDITRAKLVASRAVPCQ